VPKSRVSRVNARTSEFWFAEDEFPEEGTKALHGYARFGGFVQQPKNKDGRVKYTAIRALFIEETGEWFSDEILFDKEGDALSFIYGKQNFVNACAENHVWFDGRRYVWHFAVENSFSRLIGFPASEPLKERTNWALEWLGERFRRDGESCRWRGGFTHQAGSWDHPRRILYKLQVNQQGTNRRFVVTNCKGTPHVLWPLYDDRGTAETFIDEGNNGLAMDRLICRRFVANAFRLAPAAMAYSLTRAYRDMPAGTELESALSAEAQAGPVQTISCRLIKIGERCGVCGYTSPGAFRCGRC